MPFGLYTTPSYARASQVRVKNGLLAEYQGCGFNGLGRSGFITYSVPGGKISNEIEDRIYRGIRAQKGMTKTDAWSAVLAWRQSGYSAKDVILPPQPKRPAMGFGSQPTKAELIQAMPRIAPSVIQMAPPVQTPPPQPAPAAPAVETLPVPDQPAAVMQTVLFQEAPAAAVQTVAAQPTTWESYSAYPVAQTAPMQAEIQPQGVQTAQLPASGGNGTVPVPAAGNVMTTPVTEQPKTSFWGLATLATVATILAGGASTWKSLKH